MRINQPSNFSFFLFRGKFLPVMKKKSPLPFIFFTVFLDLVGFGILIPVIPLLLANPRSPYFLLPAGTPVSQGYILLGFLVATFSLGQFFATPILGQLSDKFGRKKLLAISLFGTCISYVFFALGIVMKSIPILFLARGLDGITGGNISVAQAAVADISTPQNRAKNFGLIGSAFGLGFILGPYIGGKLSDPSLVSWFNATTPFWFAALLSLANVISILLFFQETRVNVGPAASINWNKSIRNIIDAYGMKKLRALFAVNLLFQSGFAFFTTFFSVFLIQKFSFTQGNIGDFFAYVGLWIAFTQGFLVRRAAKRFTEYKILRVTILGVGFSLLLYFLPSSWTGLLFIVPVFAICNGFSQVNMVALVSRSADPSIQGEILGINSSIGALAQSIPPILSGFIAAALTPESPIIISSIIIVLSGLLFIRFYNPQNYALQ